MRSFRPSRGPSRRTPWIRATSSAMAAGAAKKPSPSAPKVFSRALSSKSPAMTGRSPWRSNQASRDRRRAWPSGGQQEGRPVQAFREGARVPGQQGRRPEQLHPALAQEVVEGPGAGLGRAGTSESTMSTSWAWRACRSRGRSSSRQESRRGSGSSRAGRRRRWTISLGSTFGDAHHQPEGPARGAPLERLLELPAQDEDLVRVAEGQAARGREPLAPARLLEEPLPQTLLQLADLGAEGRLGEVQALSRPP